MTSFTSLLSLLLLLVVPSVVNGATPTLVGAVDASALQVGALTPPIPTQGGPPAQSLHQPKPVQLLVAKPVPPAHLPKPVQPLQPARPLQPILPLSQPAAQPAAQSAVQSTVQPTVQPTVAPIVQSTSQLVTSARPVQPSGPVQSPLPTSPLGAACNLKRAGTAGATTAADCDTCDPCDERCDSNLQAFSTRRRRTIQEVGDAAGVRVIYGNDTSPFLSDEDMRIRIIEGRANVQLEFDCSATSNIPGVCQNMCYGINCRGHAATLTRNSEKAACRAARENNSCGNAKPNRCSAKVGFTEGHSCDEYPFASSLEGQAAGTNGANLAVTRCVPIAENSRQGQKLTTLYQSLRPVGDKYDVVLSFGAGQTGGPGYCAANAATTTCATLSNSQQNN
ncbi:hypothetical protein DENSPDRAFT_875248 [Dentipellis sp. KUC8613]|nr:hypothetical protein DENSPDRAFT_875248 [Dentipellis sp. KUC8613]